MHEVRLQGVEEIEQYVVLFHQVLKQHQLTDEEKRQHLYCLAVEAKCCGTS